MSRPYRRTPKNYDGSELTSHHIRDLIPQVLRGIGEVFKERPDLILEAWPQVIGPQLATMTQAFSFQNGILLVKVKNSTLHSLLSQHERPRLLRNLREKFPKTMIKNIYFRIG